MAKIGNYRIKKQIGEGGFGRIFQAEHVLLKEFACLKQNKNASKEEAEMLRMEAKLLWKLCEHHSIPSTKDFIDLGGYNSVMVMDYIEGKTVDDTVKGHNGLHPEDACWVTERLLGALYYSHHMGIVHADVKPENVFIEPKKRDIKLVDFGLATYKPKSGTKPAGYTPMYAAPELTQGKPPIPETDIYGAGLVMLYALGGDIAKKSVPTSVPEEIADFCNRLIRFDPKERPNWEKENPIEMISGIRERVFGRRHLY